MKRKKLEIFTVVCFTVLSLLTISYIYLILWGFLNSLKGGLEFYNNIAGWPEKFHWENYKTILQYFYHKNGTTQKITTIDMMLGNSIIYALGCTFASVATCSITAYATARFPFKFSNVVYTVVLFVMTVPIIGAGASEMQMVKTLNLYDSFLGNFVLKANFAGVYYMVFYAMFKSVPRDYEEAAQLDGAGNLTVMIRIYYPMVMNTLSTIALLYFIGFWNDFQTPYLYLPSSPTVSLGLYYFFNSTKIEISWTPFKLGACILVFIPIFIVFIIFQKRLMGNISMGGIKG